MRIFRLGDSGPEVLDVQQRLGSLGIRVSANEEGDFGTSTEAAVREFQAMRNLRVDGLVGPDTWGQLVEAGWRLGDRTLYLRAPMTRGDDVRELQRKLNALGFDAGKQDGMFGARTDAAVREFQRNVGHEPDGIVGNETLLALDRLRPPSDGPGRAVVREEESLRVMEAALAGAVIAIDPALEGDDGGESGADGADPTYALAVALADELESLGAKPALLRGEDENPSGSARARLANELGAAACISLHLNEGSAEASGPTCYYFGSTTTHSPMGRRLAELILEELVLALGREGATDRLTVAMLRETRMPAVQVEPDINASGSEERVPIDIPPRAAHAIAAGVARFFSR